MAVVQISRIQIRRGQKNQGSGLPQLASGELAWTVDTQEMYIGNGSVSEGAPAVGNTKILTENDNILDLTDQYQYQRLNATIQTGSDPAYPITRTLQERLDEHVTAASFGIVNDGTTDNSAAIQRAIDQLYLNPASRNNIESKVILEFGPGVYEINETIYIPSYTTIIGAGTGRTKFNFLGTGPVFEFINDSSEIDAPSSLASTTYINQPKYITMKGFSVLTNAIDVTAFQLNAVRDSLFEDIEVLGLWTSSDVVASTSTAFYLNALSNLVTTERNNFSRCSASGFSYGIFSEKDIQFNTFENISLDGTASNTLYQGIAFGVGTDLATAGELTGPVNNLIKDCNFRNILRYGINIETGNRNSTINNHFVNVGNNGGGNTEAVYSMIRFVSRGNTSLNDKFDRANDLAQTNLTKPYISEISGKAHYYNSEMRLVNIVQTSGSTLAFRIPLENTIGYYIDYIYQSSNLAAMRRGTITVAIDKTNGNIQLSDDYDFTGDASYELSLSFSALLVDSDSTGGVDTINIYYRNLAASDIASLFYAYRAIL